jgi:hypothetical protein
MHKTDFMIKLFTIVDEDEVSDGIAQIKERRQWLRLPTGKFQGRRLLGRLKRRLGNNITVDLKSVRGVGWTVYRWTVYRWLRTESSGGPFRTQ